ncbi:hypothetical protein NC652_038289 [Populus alba x Populus x berolinensis]|nr:hypothetical protein NC652_038289 [Populus alba x Populus x berolinensis]
MKSLSLSALTLSSLLLTMMLLNTKSCGASISLPEMEGDVPLDSIADSNLDLEFMMDSEINRILNAGSRAGGVDALIRNKPAIGGGQYNRYNLGKGSPLPPRGPYFRGKQ